MEAASDASQRAASATSSGVENRSSGMVALSAARASGVSSSRNSFNASPSLSAGQMQLTRMFFSASSSAMALVALMIQPLEALYQTSPLRGRSAVAEAVLMMTPLP